MAMMISAICKAFHTPRGKKNLLLMVVCLLALLMMSGIDAGKYTFMIFMIPTFGAVVFGDQFVRIATAFMEEELNKK